MYIAQRKRKENIAEYILYLWQLEDLLRALQFSPEAIYSQLVQKSELDEAKKQEVFFWYMDLVNLLRKEGKEENGHLEHTLHLIDDLDNLHKQLLTLPVGEKYRALYAAVAPKSRRSKANSANRTSPTWNCSSGLCMPLCCTGSKAIEARRTTSATSSA